MHCSRQFYGFFRSNPTYKHIFSCCGNNKHMRLIRHQYGNEFKLNFGPVLSSSISFPSLVLSLPLLSLNLFPSLCPLSPSSLSPSLSPPLSSLSPSCLSPSLSLPLSSQLPMDYNGMCSLYGSQRMAL